jgi:hypothetical protein
MRKNPIRDRIEYVWGNMNFPAETQPDIDAGRVCEHNRLSE